METNLSRLVQLAALAQLRRMEQLTVHPEGNPVASLSLWRPLPHLPHLPPPPLQPAAHQRPGGRSRTHSDKLHPPVRRGCLANRKVASSIPRLLDADVGSYATRHSISLSTSFPITYAHKGIKSPSNINMKRSIGYRKNLLVFQLQIHITHYHYL